MGNKGRSQKIDINVGNKGRSQKIDINVGNKKRRQTPLPRLKAKEKEKERKWKSVDERNEKYEGRMLIYQLRKSGEKNR